MLVSQFSHFFFWHFSLFKKIHIFGKINFDEKKCENCEDEYLPNRFLTKKTAKKKFKNCETNICLIDFKMCEIAKSIHASIDKYLNT